MRRIRTMLTVEEETKIIAKSKARKTRRSAPKKEKAINGEAPPASGETSDSLTETLVDATQEAVAKVEEWVDSATESIKAVFEPASAAPKAESPSQIRAAKPRGQKKPLVVPQVVR